MRRLTRILSMAAVAFSSAPGAHAAPQILAAVATAQPLKVHCAGGLCQAEIPTLCLEQKRNDPIAGHVYNPVDVSVFSIVARNGAGQTVRVALPAATFRAARGFTASEVKFRASALQARGLTPVGLSMSASTILVPAPGQGDPNPITPNEVNHAKNVLWPTAKQVLAAHPQKVAAIGMIDRMLNGTPLEGPMAAAARSDMWQNTFGTTPRAAASEATGLATGALATCQNFVAKGFFFTLRACLDTRVDKLLVNINIAYWQKVKNGGA